VQCLVHPFLDQFLNDIPIVLHPEVFGMVTYVHSQHIRFGTHQIGRPFVAEMPIRAVPVKLNARLSPILLRVLIAAIDQSDLPCSFTHQIWIGRSEPLGVREDFRRVRTHLAHKLVVRPFWSQATWFVAGSTGTLMRF
jgi:hypothetical protein